MIDVRMNLDSFGLGVRVNQLVRIVISNDGTGTEHRGNYKYQIYGRDGRFLKEGAIRNWPRKSKVPIRLLQAVINDAYPKETKQ
jgi:hypothetical protein